MSLDTPARDVSVPTDASAPPHSSALLAEVLDAHGGLARWRTVDGLGSTILGGGQLWSLKGVDAPTSPRSVYTSVRRQHAVVAPFGSPDWHLDWSPERVAIETELGGVVAERADPRAAFAGHTLETPWDPLHAAYFTGYAMWLYHALPFVLAAPGVEVEEIAPVLQDGVRLRGLLARLPPALHSHTRVQRFYFDPAGLLRRHDYDVDVLGGAAAGHLLGDYVEVEGFQFPTRRRVHPRLPDGSLVRDIETIRIDLSEYRIVRTP